MIRFQISTQTALSSEGAVKKTITTRLWRVEGGKIRKAALTTADLRI